MTPERHPIFRDRTRPLLAARDDRLTPEQAALLDLGSRVAALEAAARATGPVVIFRSSRAGRGTA